MTRRNGRSWGRSWIKRTRRTRRRAPEYKPGPRGQRRATAMSRDAGFSARTARSGPAGVTGGASTIATSASPGCSDARYFAFRLKPVVEVAAVGGSPGFIEFVGAFGDAPLARMKLVRKDWQHGEPPRISQAPRTARAGPETTSRATEAHTTTTTRDANPSPTLSRTGLKVRPVTARQPLWRAGLLLPD